MKLRYSYISFLVLLFSAVSIFSQEEFVCVWRNPERNMTRIFPDALDYRSIELRIAPEKRVIIEERLGSELLRGQQTQFSLYEMIGEGGEVIGHTIASSQRGQFGAIEFVFGLNKDHTIKDIYIQRTRERNTAFRERDFLQIFIGSGIANVDKIAQIYDGPASHGTDAVIVGLRKELVTFDEVVLKQE